MIMYRVWFDTKSAMVVRADDHDMAKLVARLHAFVLIGRWLEVEKVEEIGRIQK